MAQADSHQPRMDWRSPVFRQCAINKMWVNPPKYHTELYNCLFLLNKSTEAIAGTGMIPSNANTVMMERRIYSRANTREDYLTLTARVIIRIRDMGNFFQQHSQKLINLTFNFLEGFDNYGSQSPPREE